MRDYEGVHLVVPPGGSFRETRRIELGARWLTIGRAEACDVRVDVPGVDDEHAKINSEALVAVGPDCAMGDVPLDAGQRRLVTPGDEIQIGSVVLALEGDDPTVSEEARGAIRIRVVEGQNAGDELLLTSEDREYVIGRSPKADLLLEDREVSREHIKVVRRGFAVFIFDAASTRGSWLGRSAVYQGSRVEWQHPRMLKLGATVLSLDLPLEVRAKIPAAQVSAPMTAPPPRARGASVKGLAGERLFQGGDPSSRALPISVPSERPRRPSNSPPAGAEKPPSIRPPHASSPPRREAEPVAMPSRHPSARTAWKKSGPTIGRASGLLLLTLAGFAVLGVLFVVFSLME